MTAFLESMFGAQWWVYASVSVYGLIWALLKDSYKKDSVSWKRINGWLIQDSWANRYRDTLGKILVWIDERLSLTIEERVDLTPMRHLNAAWSFKLLRLSVLLSLTYPMITLLLQWSITGSTVSLGSVELLPAAESLTVRFFVLFCTMISIFLIYFYRLFFLKYADVFFALSLINIMFNFLIIFLQSRNYDGPMIDVVFFLAFMPIVFFLFLSILSISSVIIFELTFIFYFSYSFALASGYWKALPFVFVAALLIFLLQREWAKTHKQKTLSLLLYIFVLLGSLITAMRFGLPDPWGHPEFRIILFLGFLPMLNSIADFFSVGLTRYCLKRGLNGVAWKWAVYDLLGALFAFLILIISFAFISQWVSWPGFTDSFDRNPLPARALLFDFQNTLVDVRTHPADYWWLYITFLTTLLPTALHASVAILAIGLSWFAPVRGFIVAGLKAGSEGDSMWGMAAVWVLASCLAVSVMIPVLIIGEGIPALPGFGFALLSFFEWIAGLMARV